MKKLFFKLLISIPAFVIMLEVSARIDDKIVYNAPLFKKYRYDILLKKDNEGIFHNVPNAQFEKWKINSLGFRGNEIRPKKKENRINIVCLGASETFGFYESSGGEWPAQLDKLLKANFSSVDVFNASVIGLTAQKRKEYVKKYVLPVVEPDILIIYPRFFDYILVPSVYAKWYTDKAHEEAQETQLQKIINQLESNLRIRPKLKKVALEKCMPEFLIEKFRMWKVKRTLLAIEQKVLEGKSTMDKVPQKRFVAFERDMNQFVHFLKKMNITPILSTYPTLVTEVNRDSYKLDLMKYRFSFIHLSEDGVINAFKAFNIYIKKYARRAKVICIDNDNLIPKSKDFFGDYVHYTDKGARLIARNFFDQITTSGLLEKAAHQR